LPEATNYNLLALGLGSPFNADDESRTRKSGLSRPAQNRRLGPSRLVGLEWWSVKPELREYKAVYVQSDAEIGLFSDEVVVNCAP